MASRMDRERDIAVLIDVKLHPAIGRSAPPDRDQTTILSQLAGKRVGHHVDRTIDQYGVEWRLGRDSRQSVSPSTTTTFEISNPSRAFGGPRREISVGFECDNGIGKMRQDSGGRIPSRIPRRGRRTSV